MSMAGGWVEAEFEAIFRAHFARVARVTRRVVLSDAEAEEIASEVFLRLYQGGPEIASGASVGGWLYRTAMHAAIDVLRRNHRRGVAEPFDEEREEVRSGEADDALTRLVRGERIAQVRAVLARMKRSRAELLLLRSSGLSYQEIAEAMKMSAGSVGTTLARAEKEFTKLYTREQKLGKAAPRLETAKEG
jgi:RNA polymerase sigma-70 factor (ECF subfamily)